MAVPVEEKEVPEHIKKFYKKRKKIKRVVNTTKLHHSEAYDAGLRAILDERGEVDMDKLKTEEGQKKFVGAMKDHYLTEAKAALHIKGDHTFEKEEDEKLYNARVMNAYAGITEEQLLNIAKEAEDSFTKEAYLKIHADKHVEELEKKLRPVASDHLKDEHKKDIVEEIKASELIDHKSLPLPDAVDYLEIYDEGKRPITEEMVRKKVYHKKKTE